MLFFLLLLIPTLFFYSANGQDYCRCNDGLFDDPNKACLTSDQYDVKNSCYVCPVLVNGSLKWKCDSMYRLGYALCNQDGALEARREACLAIGGSIESGEFRCVDFTTGTNLSQLNCQATTPTTTTSTDNPTSAPTSSSPSTNSNTTFLLLFVQFSLILLFRE